MTAKVQEAAVQAADENIFRRQIVAPFDGTVLEVFSRSQRMGQCWGGRAAAGPTRPITSDGFLSGSDFDSAEIAGRHVTVEVELARGRRVAFHGRVVFVSPLIQHGNKFRVRAVVANERQDGHWLLRPGMEATMVIDLRN